MRSSELQRRKRTDLVWYLVGFVVAQIALGVGLERYWLAVRDPQYADLEQIVRARQAEAPGRPLVLALGSSRTLGGLHAERLNNSADDTAPLVINSAMLGGGPILDQVVLRRMLGAGIRPSLVVVEIMPISLSAREGAPIEERQTWSSRFTAAEVARLWPFYAESHRLWRYWAIARILPCDRYQAELRDALGIDLPAAEAPPQRSRDAYGYMAPCGTLPSQQIEEYTRRTLEDYKSPLTQPALASSALRAFRAVVDLCRGEGIDAVLIIPPESRAFRTYCPAVARTHANAVRDLAGELDLPLIDARAWVADAGFWDGHHMNDQGASQYTERFGREVLAPWCSAKKFPLEPTVARVRR